MLDEDPADLAQCAYNQFLASAQAVKAMKTIIPDGKIGCMIAYTLSYPKTCNPEDQLAAFQRAHSHTFFTDVMCRGYYPSYMLKEYEKKQIVLDTREEDSLILKEGIVDYIGISYYSSGLVTTEKRDMLNNNSMMGPANPYLQTNAWGWSIDPTGLRYSLNELYERYNLPIMIVENGIGYADEREEDRIHDDYRIDYMKKHLQAIAQAMNEDGVEVLDYTTWGWLDLISLGTGEMKKRYGIVYVDKDDQGNGSYKRYKKDSYYWYKKVIQSNGKEILENEEN